jgi:hypothetical protein
MARTSRNAARLDLPPEPEPEPDPDRIPILPVFSE